MKTERITFLAAPEFKAFLAAEAVREGLSVGELVRRRCERRPSEDEVALAALTAELRKAVAAAKDALRDGLHEVQGTLHELAAKRAAATAPPAGVAAAQRARKTVGGRK